MTDSVASSPSRRTGCQFPFLTGILPVHVVATLSCAGDIPSLTLNTGPTNTATHDTEVKDMEMTVATPMVRRVTETRALRRSLAAVPLLAGPLLIAALRALVAYGSDTPQTLATVRAHTSAQQAVQVLGPLGGIAMVFATLCVVRLLSRRTPMLAAIGGFIALIGWMMVPMLSASDALLGEIAQQHFASGAALYDAYNNSIGVGLMMSIFLAGHIVGMLLLGVAMLRARLTPAWAGAAVIAGTILHPVAFLALRSHFLDATSYVMVAAGFAAVAVAIRKSTDAEWDVAPEPRA